MFKLSFSEIQQLKNYFRDTFRRLIVVLLVSLAIQWLLVVAIFYEVVTMPAPDFYATNSAGFITTLNALPQVNATSEYLLKPDPAEEIEIKRLGSELE